MSRFAITGNSQLRFRKTNANQKVAFPNASRTLSDARCGRFLHSARYARFGRNGKNRPSISPSIRVSQAIKMIPPHCHFEHGRSPLPRHFEHGTQPTPLSFRTRAGPTSLSFRAQGRSPEVEKSPHETSPLRCLTAPPIEMTRRDKNACRLERLQA